MPYKPTPFELPPEVSQVNSLAEAHGVYLGSRLTYGVKKPEIDFVRQTRYELVEALVITLVTKYKEVPGWMSRIGEAQTFTRYGVPYARGAAA